MASTGRPPLVAGQRAIQAGILLRSGDFDKLMWLMQHRGVKSRSALVRLLIDEAYAVANETTG